MTEKQLIETLTDAGYRITAQRLLVWRALERCRPHPNANDLHEQLSADHPTMGMATIYNTLDLFETVGIVRTLTIDGVTHYDTRPAPHVNLICERCGNVEDVTDVEIGAWQRELAERAGYETAGRNVDIHGLCPNCRQTTEPSSE